MSLKTCYYLETVLNTICIFSKNAEILEEWTGLRPSRPTIRLDKEEVFMKGRIKTVSNSLFHFYTATVLYEQSKCSDDILTSYILSFAVHYFLTLS